MELLRRTQRVTSLFLRIPGWTGHRAGQHLDVRLTAEDGYRAERSYSIASAPGDPLVELAVERLEGGEVSPYLTEEVRPGDALAIAGPLGGYFVWGAANGGPLFLIAGGSGIAPLRSIQLAAAASGVPCRLLYSCRAEEDVIYPEAILTLTRQQPPGWGGYRRRVDAAMLQEVAWPAAQAPRCYVCGPSGFVESVAADLVALGHAPERILTERFGPTGA